MEDRLWAIKQERRRMLRDLMARENVLIGSDEFPGTLVDDFTCYVDVARKLFILRHGEDPRHDELLKNIIDLDGKFDSCLELESDE